MATHAESEATAAEPIQEEVVEQGVMACVAKIVVICCIIFLLLVRIKFGGLFLVLSH